jgi:hypothetical protein
MRLLNDSDQRDLAETSLELHRFAAELSCQNKLLADLSEDAPGAAKPNHATKAGQSADLQSKAGGVAARNSGTTGVPRK